MSWDVAGMPSHKQLGLVPKPISCNQQKDTIEERSNENWLLGNDGILQGRKLAQS